MQRDLLPLIEGTTVATKHGAVKTDHILFIASGAFHLAKPSDLLPELQGRLPIRVELKALDRNDFRRILTEPRGEPDHAIQGAAGDRRGRARIPPTTRSTRSRCLAEQINATVENIGARRLHTILERLLEEISFTASDQPDGTADRRSTPPMSASGSAASPRTATCRALFSRCGEAGAEIG